MSIFILIFVTLLLLNVLWWWRVDVRLRRSGAPRRARVWPLLWAGAMGGLLLLLISSRGIALPIRDYYPLPLLVALYLWHLIVLPAWLLSAPIVRLIRSAARAIRHRRAGPGGRVEGAWSRRRFLAYFAVAAPPLAAAGLTVISMPQLSRFRIRRFELPLPSLPPALDGLTIAHVGDAHVGSFTFGKTVKAIVEATNRLRTDLVLLPGDLINNDIKDLPEAIAMVRAFEARHGAFLCEGNHDLIPGPTAFERQSKAAGLHLLVNEGRTLEIRGEPVQILGLRWGSGGPRLNRAEDHSEAAISSSLEELLEQRDPAAFSILMAHHPHAFDPAAQAGIPLVLAGHTHGGQLMINEDFGFGPAMYRYWSGIYRKDLSTLAVSNGVGNWFPLRTSAPAEILHLTLRRA